MAAPLKTSLVPCLNPLLLKERLWSRSNKPLVFSTRTAPNKHFLTSRLVLSAPDSSSRRETLPPLFFFVFFLVYTACHSQSAVAPSAPEGKERNRKAKRAVLRGLSAQK